VNRLAAQTRLTVPRPGEAASSSPEPPFRATPPRIGTVELECTARAIFPGAAGMASAQAKSESARQLRKDHPFASGKGRGPDRERREAEHGEV
jgi:hypothetical protein